MREVRHFAGKFGIHHPLQLPRCGVLSGIDQVFARSDSQLSGALGVEVLISPEQKKSGSSAASDHVGGVVPLNAMVRRLGRLREPFNSPKGTVAVFRVLGDEIRLRQSEAGTGEPFVQAGIVLRPHRSKESVSAGARQLQIALLPSVAVRLQEKEDRSGRTGIETGVYSLRIARVAGPHDTSLLRNRARTEPLGSALRRCQVRIWTCASSRKCEDQRAGHELD